MKMLAAYAYLSGARALFAIKLGGLALGLLALGGCTALQPAPVAAVYDFGPGISAQTTTPPQTAVRASVLLESVQARPALEGTALHYRLAYANAQQLRPYAQARWSMAPADLLHQRLRSQLGAQHALLQDGQGLLVPTGSLRLYVELEEFSQVFSSPTESQALVRVHATLGRSEPSGYRLLSQRTFTAQRPAPTADAAGGVRALGQASDALVAELVQWLSATNQ